jgi:hypothetical protein
MSEVSLMLQAAVLAELLNNNDLMALVSNRVFDAVPAKPTFPYITFRCDQILEDGADCVEGSEVFYSIHVWSRPESYPGWPEACNIAGLVRDILDETELTVNGHRLVDMHFSQFRRLDDPDGITHHGVVEFRALIDAV